MMRDDFAAWLTAQGYKDKVVTSRISNVQRVERHYGDMDTVISNGEIGALLDALAYTKEDERRSRPNPSAIDIQGNIFNGLATLKSAVRLYQRFGTDPGAPPRPAPLKVPPHAEPRATPTEIGSVAGDKKIVKDLRLSLERDMETAIRRDIARLEPGLTIVDKGTQRRVASGRLDILCKDAQGHRVVIELKAGKSDRQVIGQILGYMGDLMAEDALQTVRGIIVAHDFDASSLSAASQDPRLTLYTYVVNFTFKPVI